MPRFYVQVQMVSTKERVGGVRYVEGAETFEEAERYFRGRVLEMLARGRFDAKIAQCVDMKKNGFEVVPATEEQVREITANQDKLIEMMRVVRSLTRRR